jgi:hypothetical protein
MRGDLCPYDHGNDPVVLEDMPLSSLGFPPNQSGNNSNMVPLAPTIPGAVVPNRPPPLVQHQGDMGNMRMPGRNLRSRAGKIEIHLFIILMDNLYHFISRVNISVLHFL